MSTPDNEFAARRQELSAQIAQQRGDLVAAYLRLEKPIHYAEYGMRGFGFLRKNPWVIAAVPAAFSILSTLLSLRKKKSPEPEPRQRQILRESEETPKPLKIWIGRAVRLYKLYRRVRPYFP